MSAYNFQCEFFGGDRMNGTAVSEQDIDDLIFGEEDGGESQR